MIKTKKISLCLVNSRVSPATAGCLRARHGFQTAVFNESPNPRSGCPKCKEREW